MATTETISSNYQGEKASGYIAAALLEAETLAKKAITILPGIKYQESLRKLDVSSIMADATCDFTETGVVTLSDKLITPKELQANLKLCKKTYRSHWEAQQMAASVFDELPSEFAQFLIQEVLGMIAESVETDIWEGPASTAGRFQGIMTELGADADLPQANEVTGTTVTAANVIEQLGLLADAVEQRVYSKPDFQLYVSPHIWRAYNRALGGFGSAGLGAAGVDSKGPQGQKPLDFDGIPLQVCNGLAANKMLAGRASNLFFGTGLQDDMNKVQLIDTGDILGDQNVRVVVRFTAAATYGIVGDLYTYGVTNTAND